MDQHLKDFYKQYSEESPGGAFHRVISLNDGPDADWELISSQMPHLCKGWYELAHLDRADRIEFMRDHWRLKLPYHPKLDDFLLKFFGALNDINIFIVQKKYDDPFEAHLVYSFSDGSGFFRGGIPATLQEIEAFKQQFPEVIFPKDYLAFMQIHNGFNKTTDSTGIIKCNKIYERYSDFQNSLAPDKPLLTHSGQTVDPHKLIPFYESFGMPFFQCFWAEWYPEDEMGNVYYCGDSQTISFHNENTSSEYLAFPTFLDWLLFYLERIT